MHLLYRFEVRDSEGELLVLRTQLISKGTMKEHNFMYREWTRWARQNYPTWSEMEMFVTDLAGEKVHHTFSD